MLASGFVICKNRCTVLTPQPTVRAMRKISWQSTGWANSVKIDPRDLRKARVVLDVSLMMSSLMPTEERNRTPTAGQRDTLPVFICSYWDLSQFKCDW